MHYLAYGIILQQNKQLMLKKFLLDKCKMSLKDEQLLLYIHFTVLHHENILCITHSKVAAVKS